MKIFLSIITLFNFSLNATQNNIENSYFLDSKFNDTKKVIDWWTYSDYKYSFKFKIEDKFYNVFKVKDGNNFKGHFVLNESGELISFYVGDSKNINESNVSTISPIFAEDNEINIESNENNLVNNTLMFVPPVLNVDLYQTSSSSFHSEQLITCCPFYYNEPNGPVINGCSPTTAAMLLSFYDRYSELDNLLDQELPLNHEEDRTRVDNFIKELANLMGTNKVTTGTLPNQIVTGYTNYLYSKGYNGYQGRMSANYDEYSYLINTFKNPAHLAVYTEKGYEEKDQFHSVLGVGTATVRESGRFVITHYAVEDEYLGNYYVAEKYFIRFYYIGS